MTPRCFNRPAYPDGWWMPSGQRRGRPVLRWVRNAMSRRCMSWAAPKPQDSAPARDGWAPWCRRCVWQPPELLAAAGALA